MQYSNKEIDTETRRKIILPNSSFLTFPPFSHLFVLLTLYRLFSFSLFYLSLFIIKLLLCPTPNCMISNSNSSVYPALGPKPSQTFFKRTLHPNQILLSQTSSHCAVNWYATEADEQRLPREYRVLDSQLCGAFSE